MTELKISRTTALWLIRVCTKIVRDAMNYPWNPIGSDIARFRQGGYLAPVTQDLDPQHTSWVEAMVSVCRIISACLSFQLDPDELQPILGNSDLGIEDITSVETLAGFGNDYFGLGHESNKENEN